MKIIKFILIFTALLIVFGVFSTELNKAYWDSKVKELCDKDGGVVVFEVVSLTEEQYIKNDGYKGMIQVSSERTTKPNHQFYWKNIDTKINKSNPVVVRSEYVTYRKSDQKKLGIWITYTRMGGDFPIGFHPSDFGCSNINGFKSNIGEEIFSIKME